MSSRPPPSATWEALGDGDQAAYYRKQDVYKLQWNLGNLDDYIMAGSKWGGPIALMRDDRKPVIVGKQSIGKPKIYIYSSAGALLQMIVWDHTAKIVKFGFTLAESLVIVSQDGFYRLYPLSTTRTSVTSEFIQRSLGSEATEVGVLDVIIYENGMIAFLGSLAFIVLKNWPEPNTLNLNTQDQEIENTLGKGLIHKLVDITLTEQPKTWNFISSEDSSSRMTEVLVGIDNNVLSIDQLEILNRQVTKGPFDHIVPSPNGRFIALVTALTAPEPNQLWVVSSEFTKSLSEYDLAHENEGKSPSQVGWCGSNAVVLAWESLVLVVGPFGDTLRYFYTGAVQLVTEIDGIRIISDDLCEFLQKVPDSTLQVFKPGSVSPAAILFEATEHFEKRNPKADESLRQIRSDMILAVDLCIDAAGRDFDVYWQRKLMKAASYGKTFLDLYNPSDFVTMTQTLRVLNAARYYEIGLPITLEQYRQNSPELFLSRLILRSHHLLAIRIAEFLKLSNAPVLRHWASVKVLEAKGANEDDRICQLLVERLKTQMEVAPADVARTAWATGQTALATKLLDHEPRASKQVPLLLTMKEDNLALVKAIESGDPDLVYTVLIHLRKTHSIGNFFRFVDNKPRAAALLKIYAQRNDVELLKDFYFQDDRRTESAVLSLEESLKSTEFGDRITKVKQSAKYFNEDKERGVEAKMMEDYTKLLTLQSNFEKESTQRKDWIGLSVNETIRQCILIGWHEKSEKLRNDFKVSDKRFWMIKIKALIEIRDWVALEQFSRSKKRPIGYEVIVENLIATNHSNQALNYIPKCEIRYRVELYLKCGEWLKAGQECRDRGDRGRLLDLRQRVPNNIIGAQIDNLLDELGGRDG